MEAPQTRSTEATRKTVQDVKHPPEGPIPGNPEVTAAIDQLDESLLSDKEKFGEMSQEDLETLRQDCGAFIEKLNPEAAKYLSEMQPRLEKTMESLEKHRQQNMYADSVEDVITFLEREEKAINLAISQPESRELILSYIHQALDTAKLQEDVTAMAKMEGISTAIEFVPLVGPAKIMTESARGTTMAGQKLNGTNRAIHAATGVGMLAIDAVALLAAPVTGGTSVLAEEGIKAGVVGTVRAAPKALKLASSLQKLAAFIRKTTGAKNTARAVFRLGTIIRKNPMAGKMITNLLNDHRKRLASRSQEIRKKAEQLKS